MLIHWFK